MKQQIHVLLWIPGSNPTYTNIYLGTEICFMPELKLELYLNKFGRGDLFQSS